MSTFNGLRNVEWLNHNSARRYPLAVDATCTDLSGSFQLPNDFIVELNLRVRWDVNYLPNRFFISSISTSADSIVFDIAFSGDDVLRVGRVSIAVPSHQENKSYSITTFDTFADSKGFVTIGELGNLLRQPAGRFIFSLPDTRFDEDVITPQLRAVTAIQVANGDDTTTELTGVVRLTAGVGTRLRSIVAPGGPTQVFIDSIGSEGLRSPCDCGDTSGEPIRSVNGISAPNIELIGSECLAVSASESILTLINSCSQPCCGPREAEVLTQQLELLQSQFPSLNAFVAQLLARVAQLEGSILASQLGDRSCINSEETAPGSGPDPE